MQMKKKAKLSLKNLLSNSNLGKNEYDSIIPAINDKNYTTLLVVSVTGAILLAVLSVVASYSSALSQNLRLYQGMAMLFIFFILAALAIVSRNHALSLPFMYALISSAYAFGIVIGTFTQPEMPATTFIVLLFAAPLLLVDRPFRCGLMNIAAAVCFCICSYCVKEPNIYIQDLVNTLSFTFLSIAVNFFYMRTKLRDILNQNYIEHERDTDALTSLLNYAAGSRESKAYIRTSNDTAALLIFDIDNFKYYNDTYGHACGDSILSLTGDAMRSAFRSSDTLARMGGDEFIIFLPKVVNRAQIDACLQRLNTKLHSDFKNVPHSVTLSIGIAIYPEDSSEYGELYGMADKALYCSKRAGKNRVSYHSDISDVE